MGNKLLSFADRLTPQENLISTPAEVNIPDVVPSNNQLLDYIFGLDPVTQLPCGDLSIYLGDKANPEVRQFIELNLLQEVSDSKGFFSFPDEVVNKFKSTITDDDIAAFSRNHNETREEYADRMKLYFLQEKKRRRDEGYFKKLEELSKPND